MQPRLTDWQLDFQSFSTERGHVRFRVCNQAISPDKTLNEFRKKLMQEEPQDWSEPSTALLRIMVGHGSGWKGEISCRRRGHRTGLEPVRTKKQWEFQREHNSKLCHPWDGLRGVSWAHQGCPGWGNRQWPQTVPQGSGMLMGNDYGLQKAGCSGTITEAIVPQVAFVMEQLIKVMRSFIAILDFGSFWRQIVPCCIIYLTLPTCLARRACWGKNVIIFLGVAICFLIGFQICPTGGNACLVL